jgi:hypothetical protein
MYSENLKERDYVVDRGTDDSLTVKQLLKKYNMTFGLEPCNSFYDTVVGSCGHGNIYIYIYIL